MRPVPRDISPRRSRGLISRVEGLILLILTSKPWFIYYMCVAKHLQYHTIRFFNFVHMFIATYSRNCELQSAGAPESSSGNIFNSCKSSIFFPYPYTKSHCTQVFGVKQKKNFNVQDLIGSHCFLGSGIHF